MEDGCALKTVDTQADGTRPEWLRPCYHYCWWRRRWKFWGYI